MKIKKAEETILISDGKNRLLDRITFFLFKNHLRCTEKIAK